MVAAVLSLLAFMLAYTFGMASTRFDARKQAVLEEAHAIRSSFLRARLLPEPQATRVAGLLQEYVDVRIRGVQEGNVAEAVARSEELLDRIWAEAVKAAEQNPRSIMTGLFIQSLNDMIEMHARRVQVGTRSRIPITIWAGLFTLLLLGMAALGYQSGLSETRRSPAMLGMIAAFAGVLFLIMDLDRSYEGFLRVSQQALIDVQKSMQAGKTP